MSTPVLKDTSAFEALAPDGSVKPADPQEAPATSLAAETPVSTESASTEAAPAGEIEVEGEVDEQAAGEDDEDPADRRVYFRTKGGKFAPHTKKKIVPELRGRIGKLTAQRTELERELQTLRQKPAPEAPAPTLGTSGDDLEPDLADQKYQGHTDPLKAFMRDYGLWAARQDRKAWQAEQSKVKEAETQQQADAALRERFQAFRTRQPDFDEVMTSQSDVELPPVLQAVLKSHARGPDMAYYLGTHRDELLGLALQTLQHPATPATISTMGKYLETRLASVQHSGAAPSARSHSAPRPLSPVRTGAGTRDDGPPDSESFEAFVARENAAERKRRR